MSLFEQQSLIPLVEHESSKVDALTAEQLRANDLYVVSMPIKPPQDALALRFPVRLLGVKRVGEGHDMSLAVLDSDLNETVRFAAQLLVSTVYTYEACFQVRAVFGYVESHDYGYIKGYNDEMDDMLRLIQEDALLKSGAADVPQKSLHY